MKNIFNGWDAIQDYDLDTLSNLIVSGRTVKEALPDHWLFKYLGNSMYGLKIMDFGCGFGRNTFQMGLANPLWTIVGYDNEVMISKTSEYYSVHYSDPAPKNIWFISNWEELKKQKFDTIFCCLVLQHIYEDVLKQYISDFKKMTSKLVVSGRRFNDDVNRRSTWRILEDNGLIPTEFLYGDTTIDYQPDGESEDHHLAIYTFE